MAHSLSMPLSSCLGCLALLIWLPFLRSQLRRMFFLPYVFYMWLCFACLSFVFWVSLLSPFLVTIRRLLSRPLSYVSFPGLFVFSPYLFDPGLVWWGSVYLVTTAGFVADQLMWNRPQQRRVRFCLFCFYAVVLCVFFQRCR